jgi:Tol biopolymer transport system component
VRRLTIAALLCGAILFAWAAVSSGASTTLPAGPRLAVVLVGTDEAGTTEVVTIGPDGEDVRSLARGTYREPIGFFEHPNWSPDGKLLAFNSQGEETPAVALLGADGSNLHLLRSSEQPGGPDDATVPEPLFDPKTNQLVVAVVHTPNGEGLFGDARPTGNPGVIRTEYWSLPVDGREPRRLSSRTLSSKRPLIPFPFSISSSGKIAASAVTRRGFAIVTVDPRTGDTRVVVPTTTQAEGSVEPAISPDGQEIVYKVDKGKGDDGEDGLISTDLMIVPTAGGRPRLLARVKGGARWPSWDPSGSRIAFTALNAAGDIDYPGGDVGSALMEINPDGSCLTKVFSVGSRGAVQGAAWQPGPGRGAARISC